MLMRRNRAVTQGREPWEQAILEPVVEWLNERFEDRIILSGPFPGGRHPIFIGSRGMLVLVEPTEDGVFGVVDYTVDTEEYGRATGERYAGFNHPVAPMPDTFEILEGYIQWLD
jgi:hypothetical protein